MRACDKRCTSRACPLHVLMTQRPGAPLPVSQVDVTDYELLHEYRLDKEGLVTGRQRSALYLQPQEAKYFEAGGRAVAVYDYDFVMRRVPPPEDAPAGAVACVPTPKGVVQCL